MGELIRLALEYRKLDSPEELEKPFRGLLDSAQRAFQQAYAPYSGFRVGAAVLLENGEVVSGSNKENASFPAGTCAERNVLHAASDRYPETRVVAIAIASESNNTEVFSPCGICRQVMVEVELHQKRDITVILLQGSGNVAVFQRAAELLPFAFSLPK